MAVNEYRGSTALVNKSPSQIVVTNIDQFILPSCIHAGTILDAIFTKDSLMGIDLHTFTRREFIPPACTQAEVDGIRDSIFDKAVEYFKRYGVHVGGGTFFADGWVDASKHPPRAGEMVMVWTKEFDLAEWDGQRFVHRYSPGLCVLTNVKHWRRLPMPPGAK